MISELSDISVEGPIDETIGKGFLL